MSTTRKNSWDADSFEELAALTTLDECKAALKAKETQRLAHKKHYLKQQKKNELVKQLMIDKPELFTDLD